MKAIGDMLFEEVRDELLALQEEFTPADYDRLEAELHLQAACLSWTGDPLKQPPRAVLAAARIVAAEKQHPAVLQSTLP